MTCVYFIILVSNTANFYLGVSEAQTRELARFNRRTDQRGRTDRGADEATAHVRDDRRRQVEQLPRLQQLRHAVSRPQVAGGRVATVVRLGGRDHGNGRQQ